jgi:hypothetical protein
MVTRIFENKTRVMSTKLTLTIDKSIIERAKFYAKNTGRSLSELIENYLADITKESSQTVISSKLEKIVGSVKLPNDFNEEEELQSYFEKKHK